MNIYPGIVFAKNIGVKNRACVSDGYGQQTNKAYACKVTRYIEGEKVGFLCAV